MDSASVGTYRAPMRSRRDDVDPGLAVERALALGVCGTGGRLPSPPKDLAAALRETARTYDERTARRLERFAAVPLGAYVWTRDVDGLYLVGRVSGGWRYDATPEAFEVDLVHVRDCDWREKPVPVEHVPPAVLRTYARGGRNFQQTHDDAVTAQSALVWGKGPR